ncbi:MAG: pentapeptide repeat-containing protein [Gammaproteobacteria bacterium]|nr:pentapeptide repeat-containing protein [Gammaproteobacteria bacterium]
MTTKPQIKDDPLYLLLREGKIEEFNQQIAAGKTSNLVACDFRNVDLRGIEAEGLDFSDCYFHQTDLRGLDLRQAKLEGASINGARISGTYFPEALTAEEIGLSLVHGTRMRYQK